MVEHYQGIARVKAVGTINEFPDSPHQRVPYSVTDLVTERDH
jgi:hypothetical protein